MDSEGRKVECECRNPEVDGFGVQDLSRAVGVSDHQCICIKGIVLVAQRTVLGTETSSKFERPRLCEDWYGIDEKKKQESGAIHCRKIVTDSAV